MHYILSITLDEIRFFKDGNITGGLFFNKELLLALQNSVLVIH